MKERYEILDCVRRCYKHTLTFSILLPFTADKYKKPFLFVISVFPIRVVVNITIDSNKS